MVCILVAEDDKAARRLMEDILADNGYEPLGAGDGLEALELLDHKHIDLMIVDVMMPRMDGCALTRELRENGWTLPILMVTAKVTREDKKRGFRLGADDYMTKPVDEEELLPDELWDLDTESGERPHRAAAGAVPGQPGLCHRHRPGAGV